MANTPTPVQVAPAEAGKKTSAVIAADSDQATVRMEQEKNKCFLNDQEFSSGARILADGVCYECSFGCWVEVEE